MKLGKYTVKTSSIITIAIAVIIAIVMIKTSSIKGLVSKNQNIEYPKGKVLELVDEKLSPDKTMPNLMIGYQNVKIEIIEGAHKGEQFNVKNNMSRIYNVKLSKDQTIIAALSIKNGQVANVGVNSYKRDNVLFGLVAFFFILLILIGGKKGVKSIFSLCFTAIVIVYYLVPSIFKGTSPIVSATISAILITVISLLIIAGVNKKGITAILGTVSGVIFAGIIAYVAGRLAHISIINSNEIDELLSLADMYNFNLQGLMYTAILISSLGAIMDIAMSISSSMYEIREIKPAITSIELFKSSMNVGKDIIGTMSSTLILAFAGASLNIMLFIVSSKMPYNQLVNLDIISSEVIQGVAGSIGIILTVPLTAAIVLFVNNLKSK